MFIDPLMWVLRKFGKGTDIFGMAHILLLLMFGMHAAYNHGRSSSQCSRDEEYNAICRNRATLRDILRLGPKGALDHATCPLLPRWRDCPTPILELLSRQVGMPPQGRALRTPTFTHTRPHMPCMTCQQM